jgi:PKD repeat protein
MVVAVLLTLVSVLLVGPASSVEISGPAVITVPGTYVLEENLTLHGGRIGIEILAHDVMIEGNGLSISGDLADNSCGILVHAPAGRIRNVTVRNLRVRDLQYGCYFWNTEGGGVSDCLVESCTYGITFNPGMRGCVTACRLENNDYGIVLSGRSLYPEIVSNRITDSIRTGLYLLRTRGGQITDNYLVNNRNVYVGDQVSGINWSSGTRRGRSIAGGALLGGNFWGRPNGHGFSQTVADADANGIGDRTYPVAGSMVDRFPLRSPRTVMPPTAGFSASPSAGTAPLTVAFNDSSRGDCGLWSWDFGDGGASIERNSTHVYSSPGRYTVTLRVAETTGSNVSIRTRSITVAAPLAKPVAAFRATPRNGFEPLVVQFTDLSTGNPREWRWSFGDGTHSTERNPRHIYRKAGSYTVSLRVSNAAGVSTRTAIRYVTLAS